MHMSAQSAPDEYFRAGEKKILTCAMACVYRPHFTLSFNQVPLNKHSLAERGHLVHTGSGIEGQKGNPG